MAPVRAQTGTVRVGQGMGRPEGRLPVQPWARAFFARAKTSIDNPGGASLFRLLLLGYCPVAQWQSR